jgi:radical SAM protein with 4Fe4S-binding SPASM domain
MPEMSFQTAASIVEQAIHMNVKRISFSGGEPLLWQNLENLIQTCCKAGLDITVYTSGCAPDNIATIKRLKTSGLNKIIFSLYAASPDLHDSITMTNHSFQQTVGAIQFANSIDLVPELHFVPILDNYLELPAIAELASKCGVKKISILRFVPQGRGKIQENISLTQKETQELRELIDRANKFIPIRIGSPYSILLSGQSPKCMAGIDRLTIAPDLTISPCDAFKRLNGIDVVGTNEYSLLDKWTLQECWAKSPYLNIVREYIKAPLSSPCSSCKLLTQCYSGCTAQKYLKYGTFKKAADPLCLREIS